MRKWFYNNPWIWIALFLGSLVLGSFVVVVIAEVNKPEIVKSKTTAMNCQPQGLADLQPV